MSQFRRKLIEGGRHIIWMLSLTLLPVAHAGQVTSKGGDIVIDTKGGLSIATADDQFSFKIAGRAQWDLDSYDGALTSDGDRKFGGDLRRGRLEMMGGFYTNWTYLFTINIGQENKASKTNFSSVGVGYKGWDWGTVFIGRTKEPFGFEELTSSKSISTIERAYWVEATDVSSQPNYGVRFDGMTGYGLGWSAAINNPNDGPADDDGQEDLALTARVFYAPWAEYDNALHFGFAYSDRGVDDAKTVNGFKLDVAEHGGELDSAEMSADDDVQWDLEAFYLAGPLSVQSEYFHRELSGANGDGDGEVDAYYLQVTYTLTGETRGYKKKKGYTNAVTPGSNGAWELVAKYDFIEFDRDQFDTEEANGILLGVNYYPNKNLRFMANVIRFDSDGVISAIGKDEDANVVSLRMQFTF